MKANILLLGWGGGGGGAMFYVKPRCKEMFLDGAASRTEVLGYLVLRPGVWDLYVATVRLLGEKVLF